MKKLILLSAMLVLAFRAHAQTAPPAAMVLVRIAEGPSLANVVVTRGIGKSEKLEFKTGSESREIVESSENYYKILDGLLREGYVLQGTFTNSGGFVATLIFVKKP